MCEVCDKYIERGIFMVQHKNNDDWVGSTGKYPETVFI